MLTDLYLVQQEVGEQEVAKVIGANLHLEALLSLGVGAHHDAGIVQEYVDPLLLGVDLLGALPDRGETGQVALVDDEVGIGDLKRQNLHYNAYRLYAYRKSAIWSIFGWS